MTYAMFKKLIAEAATHSEVKEFVSKSFEENRYLHPAALDDIFTYAQDRCTKRVRLITGLSRAEFCRRYDIPYRSCEEQEALRARAPQYVTDHLAYTVIVEKHFCSASVSQSASHEID